MDCGVARRRGDGAELTSRSKEGETACGNFSLFFKTLRDPRRGNAKRHDLHEMLVVALLTGLSLEAEIPHRLLPSCLRHLRGAINMIVLANEGEGGA